MMTEKALKYSDLWMYANLTLCRILPDSVFLFQKNQNAGFCRIASIALSKSLNLNTNNHEVIAG
jgi:hypothetical protein